MTTRERRKAAGLCVDCETPSAPSIRCPKCAEERRQYAKRYYGEILAGKRQAPPNAQATAKCEHCGSTCRKRFCSVACYRDSGAAAANALKGMAKARTRRRVLTPNNPHRNYALGISNLEYTRKAGCQCSKCLTGRSEGRAARAALVEKVAREMGVPVASGPGRTMVRDLPPEAWHQHFEAVHQARRNENRETGKYRL